MGLKLSFLIFLFQILHLNTVTAQALRISCEVSQKSNNQLSFWRSDAGDSFYPNIYTFKDPNNLPFKEILTQQVVYSTDDSLIVFIAAEDSNGQPGVYKAEINNSLKNYQIQFLNSLPTNTKELKKAITKTQFRLFSYYQGYFLYPSNQLGQWTLINLKNGSVLKQWNQRLNTFNPLFKDQLITWTRLENQKTYIDIFNLKTNSLEIISLKDDVQVLDHKKNEIFFMNTFKLISKSQNTKIRLQSYSQGITKLIQEFNSQNADYDNFMMIQNYLFFTSEKTIGTEAPYGVVEAQLNIYDYKNKVFAKKIAYAPFLLDLLKKYGNKTNGLLQTPNWSNQEIIFSLNSLGGLIKFNFSNQNWLYLGYPFAGNACFNPSYSSITE